MTDALPFWKMHGAGNDFVLMEAEASEHDWSDLARRICDRHFGVGADGLILVLPSEVADRRMRIINADGSESEMCGNGVRCFVKFCVDRGLVSLRDGTMTVETIPGVLECRAALDGAGKVASVRVAMGRPNLEPASVGVSVEQAPPVTDLRIPLPAEAGIGAVSVALVSMGNPHAVQRIEGDPARYPLHQVGPHVEHHQMFANRTNFEVINVRDRSHITMRVWERGVGETLACGSGACAVVVASRVQGLVDDTVEVAVPGGVLNITWDGAGEVYLEGPAARVFESHWGQDE